MIEAAERLTGGRYVDVTIDRAAAAGVDVSGAAALIGVRLDRALTIG